MEGDGFLHDEGRVIFPPAPLGAHRILMVAPAEDTLVRTGKRWRGLHTLIARDAVEAVLITPAYNPLVDIHIHTHYWSTTISDITATLAEHASSCWR